MEIKAGAAELINKTRPEQGGSSKEQCLPLLHVASRGIWLGDNPLDFPYPLVLAQIAVLLLTSRVLHCFLRPLGQTKFICNLLAGIILGPSLLGQSKAFSNKMKFSGREVLLFDTIPLMGVIYSFFLITVKFDMSMFKRTAKSGWKIGLVGFLFPSAVTSTLVYTVMRSIPGLNGGTFIAFYITFSLSFTYFPVITEALDELHLMTSELGQLAMSSAVVNDIIAWTFTTTHLTFIKGSVGDGVKTFFSLLGMILFTIFVIRPVMKMIIKNTPEGKEVKENYITAIQGAVLIMAFVSDIIGMKATTGPMLLGLAIPNGPPLGAAVVQKTEFVVSEFLLPLFFFRVGFNINVHSFNDWTSFTKLQLLIIVSYASKIIAITVTALFCKVKFKNSVLLSLIMSMKGLIELVVYSRWRDVKFVDDRFFTQITLSTLGMTMIATPLVRFLYVPLGSRTVLSRVRNIQSTQMNSETFRILCCVHNEESVPNIISLLEASTPTESSPICAYIVHAVELVGRAAPLLVPCDTAKQRTKLSRKKNTSHHLMQAFQNYAKTSNGPVIIQGYTMHAPYKYMHGTLFQLADDKFIPLIIIPFHENHQEIVAPSTMASIRQFNADVQSYASCTVGILVDKGLSCRLSFPHFSCNVALFFIGGPDDREALAYAARMSDNPNVGITVFRIQFRNKFKEWTGEEQAEVKLDESLVDEFRLGNIGNEMLNWKEIEVDDGVQLMDEVMNLQGSFDLVIVGRRHADMTLRDEEMAEFVENAELGVVGDIVASSDFCGGTVNVLVIQESRELGCGIFRSKSVKESEVD